MGSSFSTSLAAGGDAVAQLNAAFATFAEAHAVPAAVRRSMAIALDELLTNTVSYGLPREGREVTLEVELRPDRLIVTVSDNCEPFDPVGRSAPDTTSPLNERPMGGLGVHLVRQLVEDVSYRRRGDRNEVTLAQRLAAESTTHTRTRSMEITTRTQGDVSIVAIAGKLDSVTSPQAQEAFEAIVKGGARKIAVDFSRLDYISSAGLRVLLGTAKKLTAAGGALRTFGLNDTVREVFDISGFSTILRVFPSEADALNGF